jgi:hypothetical protein
MAAALTLVKVVQYYGGLRAYCTLALTGSYTTGGDVCTIVGLIPNLATVLPIAVRIQGQAGYDYSWIAGATQALGKVRVGVNTGAGANLGLPEHTAAAYNAGVTGDTIQAILDFAL